MDYKLIDNKVTLTVNEDNVYNMDSTMELCIVMCARRYWEQQGEFHYNNYTNPKGSFYNHDIKRYYQRLKAAINVFEGKTEDDLMEMKYSFDPKVTHRYFKAMDALYDSRGPMWV